MSDPLNTQSESTDVTVAEPEPAAPAEEMPIVSYCQVYIILHKHYLVHHWWKCLIIARYFWLLPNLLSLILSFSGCCWWAGMWGCAARRAQTGSLWHAMSDATCCGVCGDVSRVIAEWTHCSRGLHWGLELHHTAWKTFFLSNLCKFLTILNHSFDT